MLTSVDRAGHVHCLSVQPCVGCNDCNCLMVRRRKRSKSSPLAESSLKKYKPYTSPQQAGLKINSKTYQDSESETSLETLCEVGATSEPGPKSRYRTLTIYNAFFRAIMADNINRPGVAAP